MRRFFGTTIRLTYYPTKDVHVRNASFLVGGKLHVPHPSPATPVSSQTSQMPVVSEIKNHDAVMYIKCTSSNCSGQNCAGLPNTKCAFGPRPESSLEQPVEAGVASPVTAYCIGNLTGNVPQNKPGIVVDKQKNYSMQPKSQQMVVEPQPIQVNPLDINVNPVSTAFVQESSHHNKIMQATNTQAIP